MRDPPSPSPAGGVRPQCVHRRLDPSYGPQHSSSNRQSPEQHPPSISAMFVDVEGGPFYYCDHELQFRILFKRIVAVMMFN